MTQEKEVRRPMNVEETLTAFEWCKTHVDEIARVSRAQAVERCFADTGVHIPVLRLAEIEAKLGIVRKRGGNDKVAKGQHLVARELVRLMNSLGFEPDPKLKAMVGG